jgi:hydrogenase nickel incorporation protein HypB
MEIKVLKDILSANDQIASRNRQLLDRLGIFVINIMSSPGAGKTSLLVETIRRLKDSINIGVIEGDVASNWDAEQVGKEGIPVVQINTSGGCHLDAKMTCSALNSLPLKDIKLLFIENVGNLVCPAGFALGENKRVVISSTPEGHDKPIKYPLIFHNTDAVLLNKIDLLPHLNFELPTFTAAIKKLNDKAEIIPVSCTTGEGIEKWISWIESQTGLI